MSITRRRLIGRGLGVAGAAALPTSLLAAPALAQQSEETDALEPIVELEQAAELAYSLAVEEADLDGEAQRTFELFSTHCGDHATALSEALDQLGVDPPEASSDPAEHERLADFDTDESQEKLLEFMIGLEQELIAAYRDGLPALDAEDLVRTSGQVGASHAQALVALRVLAGVPKRALTRPL